MAYHLDGLLPKETKGERKARGEKTNYMKHWRDRGGIFQAEIRDFEEEQKEPFSWLFYCFPFKEYPIV
jgi:hypothetical protein